MTSTAELKQTFWKQLAASAFVFLQRAGDPRAYRNRGVPPPP